MADWKVEGFDEYIKKLAALQQNAEPILKAAIFKGAALATDEIRKSIAALPTHTKGRQGGVREEEKAALLEGLGISPINVTDDDYLNAKIGFDGYYTGEYYYNYRRSKGKGVPIPMIARAVESGTSFSAKLPFMRQTTIKVKPQVVAVMQAELEQQFDKIMN